MVFGTASDRCLVPVCPGAKARKALYSLLGFPPYETFGSMEPTQAQRTIAEVRRLVGRDSMMAACQPRWHGVPTTASRWAGTSTNPTIAAAAIIAGVRQTVVIPLAPRRGPSRS